jgi:uncharacterized protein (DUF2252 family)
MLTPDPAELADWQLARDRSATARFDGLLERRTARMTTSPLSYLRGAAPLFYRLLAEHPELREGPPGEGWLCGDAHLENFGVYRTDQKKSEAREDDEPVVFDVNDFDEAVVGPFRHDVLRLVTSLILGGRELGADGRHSLVLSERLLAAYANAACEDTQMPPVPPPIVRLLSKVEQRTQRHLLDQRTVVVDGRRKFLLGERYNALPAALATQAVAAFDAYASSLASEHPRSRFEVLDVAFRIAGTGSLGGLRVAVLTRGKGDPDGCWLFDMKESAAPSAVPLLPAPALPDNQRVVAGMRACLPRLPRQVGLTELAGCKMIVRRLAPQEDKLNLARLAPDELEPLAAHLGALLGRAHRRGATVPIAAAWGPAEREALVAQGIALAGIHEGAYLALCNRERLSGRR